MKNRMAYILLALAGAWTIACAPEVAQEDLIRDAVDIKLGQYQSNQLEQCKENALRDAEDYVDSLLVAISLERKLDTIPKPGKPDRPDRPVFKIKPDTVVVDKLYKEEE